MKSIILALAVVFTLAACNQTSTKNDDGGLAALDSLVKQQNFQKEIGGKKTDLVTLKNDSGMIVKITNYGARIVSILVPDKNDTYADVSLGYANIDDYLKDSTYVGSIVGRYANRIANGKFKIDGKEYQLPLNDGINSLHGGFKGFDKVVWDIAQKDDESLLLTYTAQDGEEGYPGKMDVKVKYTVTESSELQIEIEAVCDKKTIVNISSHGYFNLKGEGNGDILDHMLEIFADSITPVDSTLIPTGKIEAVAGTPLDFTKPYLIGLRINEDNQQLKYGHGYDHNWVLNNKKDEVALNVRLTEPTTGRVMEVYSNKPGVQFYSCNFLHGYHNGKSGKPLQYRSGVAFEPQNYPDAPNKANFPSAILEPGKTYKSTIIYKFYVNEQQ
jgi:aldose 1-epimerase